jgi:formiminoglutamase
MPLSVFFAPIDVASIAPEGGFSPAQMGSKVRIHQEGDFPVIDGEDRPDIALIGIKDDRRSIGNKGCSEGPDALRPYFYQLYQGDYKLKMVDLGNILPGETERDTDIAVKTVVEELLLAGIVPVIVGGGQEFTYAQYTGYEKTERKVEVAVIDPRFDLDQEHTQDAPLNSRTYLNHLILHSPDFLFNLNNLAHQTYFVSKQALEMYDKLNFNVMRLGLLSHNIEHAEPAIRSADMVSFDMSALRFSEAPGTAHSTPNGLFGDEACRMCRYAGMNDRLSSIGFYEFNPLLDQRGQTAHLLAQMIWYFIDGFYARKNDFPLVPKSSYIIYRTTLENDDYELVFVKSKKSDRWWMQVPYFGSRSVNERYHLVPCSYEDYQKAIAGEMPDLWWRTHQKLL